MHSATTVPHLTICTPHQTDHDPVHIVPVLQALPTAHLPDEEFPPATASAATGELSAIRTPRHTHHHATMPLQRSSKPTIGCLPQAHAAIITATGQVRPVRTPRHTTDPGWLCTAHPPKSACGHLPHLHPLL